MAFLKSRSLKNILEKRHLTILPSVSKTVEFVTKIARFAHGKCIFQWKYEKNYVSIPLHDFASKSSEAAASFFKMHHPVLRIWHKKNLLLPHTLKRLMEAAACCNIAKHRRFIPAKPKGYECHENCCFTTTTTPTQNIPKFRKENKKARTSDLSWKLTSFFPKFKVRRICL